MKTARLLAMLLAAFALSLSLTNCETDGDPLLAPPVEPTVTKSVGILNFAKETFYYDYCKAIVKENESNIHLRFGRTDKPLQEEFCINLINVRYFSDIRGDYPNYMSINPGYIYKYFSAGGEMTIGNGYYSYKSFEGTSNLKIRITEEDTYNISIENLELFLVPSLTGEFTEIGSFNYKGKIKIVKDESENS